MYVSPTILSPQLQPHVPPAHARPAGPDRTLAEEAETRDEKTGPATTDNAPGVIRLLEAGHFKGVADVRLRINFYDELAQRAGQRTAEQLQSGADSLIQSVAGEAASLVATLGGDDGAAGAAENLIADFEASVQSAVETAGSEGSITVDDVAASIQAAFDALVDQLRELFDPIEDATGPVAETPTLSTQSLTDGRDAKVTTAPVEPVKVDNQVGGAGDDVVLLSPVVEPIPNALDDAFAALASMFAQALTDLIETVESVSQLSDPAPAPGNGAAYANFMEIYNQLGGGEPQVDTTG
ncbi:MAG: hypothetical protein IH830_03970 [Planctomycetes bacterium]|nr:hypothetical protein [Planctomycetota bacterium]